MTFFANLFGKINQNAVNKNIVLTLCRQIFAAFIQFLIVVIIARHLGPEGNGQYAMVILLPTFLATFLNLGIAPSTVFFVSKASYSLIDTIKGNLFIGGLIIVSGGAIAVPVLYFFSDQLFPGVPLDYLWLGLLCFPISLIIPMLSAVLQGLSDFKSFNLSILLPPCVQLVLVATGILVFNLELFEAVLCYFVGQLIGLCAIVYCVMKHLHTHEQKVSESSISYRRATIRYGLRAHMSNIIAFVNYRADLYLVNFFLSPVATGIYIVSVQLSEKIWMLSQAASTVLLPKLSAMHELPEARAKLTQKWFVMVSILTLIFGGVVGLFLVFLLEPIFGESYSEALTLFFWLLPGIVAGAGERIYSNCIAAANKPQWNMYVALVTVSINIIANILLIPIYGLTGAAVATTVSYVCSAVIKFGVINTYLLTPKSINAT